MGREEALTPTPGNVVKYTCLLQMLSVVSVDDVFMHYFEKMSSAYSSFRLPYFPPVEILQAPMIMHTKNTCRQTWKICMGVGIGNQKTSTPVQSPWYVAVVMFTTIISLLIYFSHV